MESEREFWAKGKEVASRFVAETPQPPSGFHWSGVQATANLALASVSYL